MAAGRRDSPLLLKGRTLTTTLMFPPAMAAVSYACASLVKASRTKQGRKGVR